MLSVIMLYAFIASTFILAKNALAYAQPCFLIAFRMLVAGSLLLGYQWVFRRKQFFIHRGDWLLFGKVALFHIFFAFIPEFWALQYLSALKVNLIYSTTPFIAAILSYMLINERLTKSKLLGITIGLVGLIPVFMIQAEKAYGSSCSTGHLPEFVLLGAVTSACYAWFLVKRLMNKGYTLVMINGIAMLGGGFMALIPTGLFEGFEHPVSAMGPFLFWVALLILVANVIVYNFYGWLLNRYSITFISFAGFLSPSFGTIYEAAFMNGTITWHYFVCLGMVALGLYIFYRDELVRCREVGKP